MFYSVIMVILYVVLPLALATGLAWVLLRFRSPGGGQEKLAKVAGTITGVAHLALVVVMAYGANGDRVGSRAFVLLFMAVDFPVTLLYGMLAVVAIMVFHPEPRLEGDPSILHMAIFCGVIGTIWWYFLPRFFLPEKFGGLWGSKPTSDTT